jgi:hypothetical protein
MPDELFHTNAPTEADRRRGHQDDGVRETATAIVAFALAVSVPVLMIFLWLQFKSAEGARYRGLSAAALAGPQSQPTRTMPEPRLEIIPGSGLAKLRAEEDAQLNSYGWIDRRSNIVRIPIERAMEIIAQRGLPKSGPPKSEYELILERSRERNLAPLKEVP